MICTGARDSEKAYGRYMGNEYSPEITSGANLLKYSTIKRAGDQGFFLTPN